MLSEKQLKTMLLLDLELRLQSFEKQLVDFGLPVPTEEELSHVDNVTSTEAVVIREERDYDVDELAAKVEATIPRFTEEQRLIFERVQSALLEERQLLAFIDARGGCGKTFLTNPWNGQDAGAWWLCSSGDSNNWNSSKPTLPWKDIPF